MRWSQQEVGKRQVKPREILRRVAEGCLAVDVSRRWTMDDVISELFSYLYGGGHHG